MRFREYENLCIGDTVILPFSSEPEQIVVGAKDDYVITAPKGMSAHMNASYANKYIDVEMPDGRYGIGSESEGGEIL